MKWDQLCFLLIPRRETWTCITEGREMNCSNTCTRYTASSNSKWIKHNRPNFHYYRMKAVRRQCVRQGLSVMWHVVPVISTIADIYSETPLIRSSWKKNEWIKTKEKKKNGFNIRMDSLLSWNKCWHGNVWKCHLAIGGGLNFEVVILLSEVLQYEY